MRRLLFVLALVPLSAGCQRYTVRTQNRVAIDGPVDSRVTDISPVSPIAGPVRPVVVESGSAAGRVAVIDVDGLILNTPFVGPMSVGENPVALFREKLMTAEADPTAKAVVLRVNSHGGGVAACIMMRRDLERFKARTGKPVVACLIDTAAGGAYYLASAADHVVAGNATVTGGVGVILNLFNLQDLMAQFNVIPQPIKAGEIVDIGTSARPLKPAEKELLQAMADEFHKQMRAEITPDPAPRVPIRRHDLRRPRSSPAARPKLAGWWTGSATWTRRSRSRPRWHAPGVPSDRRGAVSAKQRPGDFRYTR